MKALRFLFRFFFFHMLCHCSSTMANNHFTKKKIMALNSLMCWCAFKPSFIHSFWSWARAFSISNNSWLRLWVSVSIGWVCVSTLWGWGSLGYQWWMYSVTVAIQAAGSKLLLRAEAYKATINYWWWSTSLAATGFPPSRSLNQSLNSALSSSLAHQDSPDNSVHFTRRMSSIKLSVLLPVLYRVYRLAYLYRRKHRFPIPLIPYIIESQQAGHLGVI